MIMKNGQDLRTWDLERKRKRLEEYAKLKELQEQKQIKDFEEGQKLTFHSKSTPHIEMFGQFGYPHADDIKAFPKSRRILKQDFGKIN